LPTGFIEAYTQAVFGTEVVTVIRRLMNRMKERRAARRARQLETAHRRAAEGYDEPPISMSNPGG
jgi:hypothetical protein